ncbi:MAG: hypothetical protein V5789_07520 [Colwellia sp.]
MSSIPVRTIEIDLKDATPTEITTEMLRSQLHNVGLTCDLTSDEKLEKFTLEVRDELKKGNIKAYSILERKTPITITSSHHDYVLAMKCGLARTSIHDEWSDSITANYVPSDTGGGYQVELSTVINNKHFTVLQARKFPTFVGLRGEPIKSTKKKSTPDAVKTLFLDSAGAAAEVLVASGGIDREALEAAMSNAIGPEREKEEDYLNIDDRVILLIKGYDPVTKSCEAIGAINIAWDLKIKQYKEKKTEYKDCSTTVVARTVLYSCIQNLFDDYVYVGDHIND